MIEQMDRVAEELEKLQDAGVPVLWKPFHEFDGAWFWNVITLDELPDF